MTAGSTEEILSAHAGRVVKRVGRGDHAVAIRRIEFGDSLGAQTDLEERLAALRLIEGLPFSALASVQGVRSTSGSLEITETWIDGFTLDAPEAKDRITVSVALALMHDLARGLVELHRIAGEDGQRARLLHGRVALDRMVVDARGRVRLVGVEGQRGAPSLDANALMESLRLLLERQGGSPDGRQLLDRLGNLTFSSTVAIATSIQAYLSRLNRDRLNARRFEFNAGVRRLLGLSAAELGPTQPNISAPPASDTSVSGSSSGPRDRESFGRGDEGKTSRAVRRTPSPRPGFPADWSAAVDPTYASPLHDFTQADPPGHAGRANDAGWARQAERKASISPDAAGEDQYDDATVDALSAVPGIDIPDMYEATPDVAAAAELTGILNAPSDPWAHDRPTNLVEVPADLLASTAMESTDEVQIAPLMADVGDDEDEATIQGAIPASLMAAARLRKDSANLGVGAPASAEPPTALPDDPPTALPDEPDESDEPDEPDQPDEPDEADEADEPDEPDEPVWSEVTAPQAIEPTLGAVLSARDDAGDRPALIELADEPALVELSDLVEPDAVRHASGPSLEEVVELVDEVDGPIELSKRIEPRRPVGPSPAHGLARSIEKTENRARSADGPRPSESTSTTPSRSTTVGGRGAEVGNYRIVASIGRGGMGEIYLARRWDGTRPGPLVALKVLASAAQDVAFADALAMLMDEAAIMARIENPHVLKVIDFGMADGRYYLATEYLEGRPLVRVMIEAYDREHGLDYGVIATIGADAALGLYAAHTASTSAGAPLKVIHRDVSPQNVFVTYAGVTKVIDFGVARASERVCRTEVGLVKGKAAYMSPEQAEGRDLDGRSDVFGLGVCLWEMTAGQRLFKRPQEFETLLAVQSEPIRPPTQVRGEPNPVLDHIILSALHRDRNQRTPSAQALAAQLMEFADHTVSPEHRPSGADGHRGRVRDLLQRLFGDVAAQEHDLIRRLETNAATAAESQELEKLSGVSARGTLRQFTLMGRPTALNELEGFGEVAPHGTPRESGSASQVPTRSERSERGRDDVIHLGPATAAHRTAPSTRDHVLAAVKRARTAAGLTTGPMTGPTEARRAGTTGPSPAGGSPGTEDDARNSRREGGTDPVGERKGRSWPFEDGVEVEPSEMSTSWSISDSAVFVPINAGTAAQGSVEPGKPTLTLPQRRARASRHWPLTIAAMLALLAGGAWVGTIYKPIPDGGRTGAGSAADAVPRPDGAETGVPGPPGGRSEPAPSTLEPVQIVASDGPPLGRPELRAIVTAAQSAGLAVFESRGTMVVEDRRQGTVTIDRDARLERVEVPGAQGWIIRPKSAVLPSAAWVGSVERSRWFARSITVNDCEASLTVRANGIGLRYGRQEIRLPHGGGVLLDVALQRPAFAVRLELEPIGLSFGRPDPDQPQLHCRTGWSEPRVVLRRLPPGRYQLRWIGLGRTQTATLKLSESEAVGAELIRLSRIP